MHGRRYYRAGKGLGGEMMKYIIVAIIISVLVLIFMHLIVRRKKNYLKSINDYETKTANDQPAWEQLRMYRNMKRELMQSDNEYSLDQLNSKISELEKHLGIPKTTDGK
jgi:uncharacterized membrane protein